MHKDDQPSRVAAEKALTRSQPIKLRKNRRTTMKFPKGCTLTLTTASSDGKPAVFVEYPDGTVIQHETLTPPPAAS